MDSDNSQQIILSLKKLSNKVIDAQELKKVLMLILKCDEITKIALAHYQDNEKVKISNHLTVNKSILHLAIDLNQPRIVEALILSLKIPTSHTITALQYAQNKMGLLKKPSKKAQSQKDNPETQVFSNFSAIIKLLKHFNSIRIINSAINIQENEYGFRHSKQAAEFRRKWTEESSKDNTSGLTLFRNVATIKLIPNPNKSNLSQLEPIYVTMSSVTKEPDQQSQLPNAHNHSEQIAIQLLFHGYKTEYPNQLNDLYLRVTCDGQYIIKWIYTERETCYGGLYKNSCADKINILSTEQLKYHHIPIEVFYTKPYYSHSNSILERPKADPIDEHDLIQSSGYPLHKDAEKNKQVNTSLLQDIALGKKLYFGFSNITPDIKYEELELPHYVENKVSIVIEQLKSEINELKELWYQEAEKSKIGITLDKSKSFEENKKLLTFQLNELGRMTDHYIDFQYIENRILFNQHKINELEGMSKVGQTLKDVESKTCLSQFKNQEIKIKTLFNNFIKDCHAKNILLENEAYQKILKDYQLIRSILNNMINQIKKELYLAFTTKTNFQNKSFFEENAHIYVFCVKGIKDIEDRTKEFIQKSLELSAQKSIESTNPQNYQGGVTLPKIKTKSNPTITHELEPALKRQKNNSNMDLEIQNPDTTLSHEVNTTPPENSKLNISPCLQAYTTQNVLIHHSHPTSLLHPHNRDWLQIQQQAHISDSTHSLLTPQNTTHTTDTSNKLTVNPTTSHQAKDTEMNDQQDSQTPSTDVHMKFSRS